MKLMIDQDMSVKALAKRMHLSERTIYRYIQGADTMRLCDLEQLVNHLGYEVEIKIV